MAFRDLREGILSEFAEASRDARAGELATRSQRELWALWGAGLGVEVRASMNRIHMRNHGAKVKRATAEARARKVAAVYPDGWLELPGGGRILFKDNAPVLCCDRGNRSDRKRIGAQLRWLMVGRPYTMPAWAEAGT
jgi:hypothetical protein